MTVFLRMKAWQLFILLCGAPFLVVPIGMVRMSGGDPSQIFSVMSYSMIVFQMIFMAWFWTLGTYLNRQVPEAIRPSPSRFKFCLIYTFAYIFFFLFFVLTLTGKTKGSLSALIVPFHIFAMICIFYAVYFIAQNLVMAERKEKVGRHQFAGPFFLIWMYPIGIWFIQPRVNLLFSNQV